MKLLVLYRSHSEYGTPVETFLREFRYQYTTLADRLEVLEFDSREGVAKAKVYDVLEAPAMLVLAEDGSVVNSWIGSELPQLSTVASYLYGSV
jgi:hypothetical protein